MNWELARQIKRVLKSSPDLLKKRYRKQEQRHPLTGHCYVASEAYFHAMGGYQAGYTVHRVKHEGETHWFLKDSDGEIIDLTKEQFETPVQYEKATKTGFLTSAPSERSQQVLAQINSNRDVSREE